MISNKLKALCGMVLVGGMMVSGTTIAANEAMKKFFETQLQNGNITQQQYDDLIKALEKDNQAMEKQVDEKVSEATKDVPKITTKEKFAIESSDGNFEWGIGGRVMADVAFYDNDTDINGENTDIGSGHEIRRARLEMTGTLWKVWGLKMQYDFTGDGEDGIRDAYLNYTGFTNTKIQVGHFKEPFSLEELTSSKYITFMERATPVNSFAPSRNLGVAAYTQFNDLVTVSGGFFGEGTSSGGGDDASGYGITGRVTFAPINEDGRLVHLGAAVSHRSPDQGDTASFGDRWETHVHSSGKNLIGTGDLDGVDDIMRYGLEAAAVMDRFSIQGEYINADVSRDGAFGGDVDFDGYYIYGSFFLTDDHRAYKFGSGAFDKVSPSSTVGKGGIGAWEVGLRYSSVDLNDGLVDGGDQDILTAGLNWYATKNVRFMANYNQVLEHDGGQFPGAEPAAFQARAQVFW